VSKDRERVLGPNGFVLGDGGTGSSDWLLTPISNVTTRAERLYNFFHSSTRMIVEQAFGIWKNRFRCLLQEMRMDHWLACLIVQTTMVLHNMCRVHHEADDFEEHGDDSVAEYLAEFDHGMCPDCKRTRKLHCIHQSMEKMTPGDNATAIAFRAQLVQQIWEKYGETQEVDFL
jgi:hypothetical protein